ncbi:MAG: hypothetical protein CM15mP74_01450 [Halieaceae bacterium]|nr:MAG: hypothetical protein CM15mP74_01450 [Halieaceae bacterium]
MCCDALKIAGDHNIANVLAALALGSALELPMAGLLKGAAGFRGLPHRCQLVRKVNGVQYVDDSKGTNVGATEAALTGLSSEGPIWLILGGQGKGQDFSPLQQVVSERCAGLLVLGQAAAEITDQLGRAARIEQVDTVEEAVLRASRLADLETQSAVASMCQFGYVQQLRRTWRTIPVCRSGAGGGIVIGVGRAGSLHGDTVLLTLGAP